jgi:hypothetical protein
MVILEADPSHLQSRGSEPGRFAIVGFAFDPLTTASFRQLAPPFFARELAGANPAMVYIGDRHAGSLDLVSVLSASASSHCAARRAFNEIIHFLVFNGSGMRSRRSDRQLADGHAQWRRHFTADLFTSEPARQPHHWHDSSDATPLYD